MVSSYILCESFFKHSRITVSYLKRLTNAVLGRLQAFLMYGGIGMSALSLHRESTDTLINAHVKTFGVEKGPLAGVLQIE